MAGAFQRSTCWTRDFIQWNHLRHRVLLHHQANHQPTRIQLGPHGNGTYPLYPIYKKRQAAAVFISEDEERDPEFKKARQKHTYQTWVPTLWLTSRVVLLLGYGYLAIGLNMPLSPGNILPGLLIFTLSGFLFFFCLRRYLRWFYMFIHLAIILGIGFWLNVLMVVNCQPNPTWASVLPWQLSSIRWWCGFLISLSSYGKTRKKTDVAIIEWKHKNAAKNL